jgi:pyruvate, water dikinase
LPMSSSWCPFCRTPAEADKVLAEMAENGLKRGDNGLQVYMMCEIPSNVILAEEFARRFDGFSIGSNDLTQLLLGVDRDSGLLAACSTSATRRDPHDCRGHRQGAQGGDQDRHLRPGAEQLSGFAEFLVREGIDSISLNPDSFVKTCCGAQ